MMRPEDTKALRRPIGEAIIAAQDAARAKGYDGHEIAADVLAALISLAAHIMHTLEMSREQFLEGCRCVADNEWGERDKH